MIQREIIPSLQPRQFTRPNWGFKPILRQTNPLKDCYLNNNTRIQEMLSPNNYLTSPGGFL